MTNDVNDNKPAEESAACIALSKNDSYVMSASGGKVSLFNMMTFKVCYLHIFRLTVSPPSIGSIRLNKPSNNFSGHDNIYVSASCSNFFGIPSSRQ